MKTVISFLVFLAFACFSCSENKNSSTGSTTNKNERIVSLSDTLLKYQRLDSFQFSFHNNYELDDFLYLCRLNNDTFAFYNVLEEGNLIIYSKRFGKWAVEDTFSNQSSNYKFFRRIDINNDKLVDIVFYDHQMKPKLIFLYNPQNHKLNINTKSIR